MRQQEKGHTEPPQAPWLKFPHIPGSVSMGWRMGAGENYLFYTFYPWWDSLPDARREEYLDATCAPADWRLMLAERAKRAARLPP
ncbi:MAG TPA: hypothetical protein VFQ61_07475 [Polyangiaceae bacterium]|nr:hypothetical protein [Polyangiaceae bacterium]